MFMNRMQRLSAISLAMWLATSVLAASKSPLADAAEKSDRATIRTLLKQRADVNAPQADGMTALHWAAYRDDLETAKALAVANANVMATNRYGVTPLVARLPEWEWRNGRTSARTRC